MNQAYDVQHTSELNKRELQVSGFLESGCFGNTSSKSGERHPGVIEILPVLLGK